MSQQNKNLCFAGDHVGEQFSTTLIPCVIEAKKSKDLPRILLNFETFSLGSPRGQNKQERRSSSKKWKPVMATFPLSPQSCMQDFREASVLQGVILFKNSWAEKCWFPGRGIQCRAKRPTRLSYVAHAFDLEARNLCLQKCSSSVIVSHSCVKCRNCSESGRDLESICRVMVWNEHPPLTKRR